MVDGAGGVHDSLQIQRNDYEDIAFDYTSTDSGSIKLDVTSVALYKRMEAITLTSSGPSPPADISIHIFTGNPDALILSEEGITDSGLVTIDSADGTFIDASIEAQSGILTIDGQDQSGDDGRVIPFGEGLGFVTASSLVMQPLVYYTPIILLNGVSSNLNDVIDILLNTFDTANPPTGQDAVFTSSEGEIPNIITVGQTIGTGEADLKLQDITLTFSGLVYDNGTWTGQVAVEATIATLFPGLLDIVVTDNNDGDVFASVGMIELAEGNSNSFLALDNLDVEELGWPGFLDVQIADLALNFTDFRVDDNLNSLQLSVELIGFDTGNEALNDLLSADNPLFGLSIQGFASVELGVKEIEDAVIAAGGTDFIAAIQAALAAAMASNLTGLGGSISGKLFGVGSLTATFIYNTVTLQERSAVYIAVEGALSLGPAISGGGDSESGSGGNDGGDDGFASFDIAFAVSELGPLQFFASVDVPITLEPYSGLAISSMRLGVRFNTTIEGLQTDIDFETNQVEVTPDPSGTGYRITLTVPGHDLTIGDSFRIKNPQNSNNVFYNSDFTVLTVNGDEFTYLVESDPGLFVGSAQIIRLTIRDPLDLQDSGLESGVAPPGDIFIWRDQLDQQVLDQLEKGDDIWARLFAEVVFGGGASLSLDPRIPDSILSFDVDFLLDTNLRIFLSGQMNLFDGLVTFPTRLYADLSDLFSSGSGRFLYLQTQPEKPVFEPLLVYRGSVSFETLVGSDLLNISVTDDTANGYWVLDLELALDTPSSEYAVGDYATVFGSNPWTFDGTYEVIGVDDATNTITLQIDCDVDGDGVCDPDEISATNPGTWISGGKVANQNALVAFRVALEGGVDLNIPGLNANLEPITVTTLTLEGEVQVEFRIAGPSLPQDVEMELSFWAALSETHVGNIAQTAGDFVVSVDVDAPIEDFIIIYGAARLETMFDFVEPIGLFMDANGFLRINSSSQNRSITLPDINNNPVELALPAQSFALRLGGSVDFRIDFNGDTAFQTDESVFEMAGIFVLEFSTDGFNVAVFREVNNSIAAATLRLGPKGSPFIEFNVFAFLALRGDGFAADLVLSADASLPLDLASIQSTAVFIFNTTGRDITFEIPSDGTDPNRPNGLVLIIPGAAPQNPSAILAGPGPNGQSGLSLNDLINGNTSWQRAAAGPYGVVFLTGGFNLLSVLEFDVSGYILLSKNVLSLELNFYAGGNFLNLASASAGGSLFFSSEGEFELEVFGNVQLGPNGFNISGSAHLFIRYLDNNGKASGGDGNMTLDISGSLTVSGEIFWIPLPPATVGVTYNSTTGDISVRVGPVPVPYIAKSCWSTFLGRICIYYPSFHNKYYSFTVGNLTLNTQQEPPPPPVVLGQVNNDGILILNVGPEADARNLMGDEPDESVLIERVSVGSGQGEKIRITMFGYSQTFDNVLGILIPDMGTGDDSVEIYAGVTIPTEVHFGVGSDTLTAAGPGIVTAYGDDGDDRLDGGSGNDYLFGGPDNDVLDGKAGQDWIEGGDGADVLIGGADGDTLKGGADFDRIAGDLAEITGDEMNSILTTVASESGGNDVIEGGDGLNVIFGGSKDDQIDGGPGDDKLAGDDGTVTVAQNDGISILSTQTALEFSGNDTIAGGSGNDTVFGQQGNDTIYGNENDDVIEGNAGNDIIFGNAGNDTIYGQEGNDILIGDDGNISNTSVQADVNGTDGADMIYGQQGEDKLFGGGDDDSLYGDKEGGADASLQRDIIIGDGGIVDFTSDLFAFNDVTTIATSGQSAGGDDLIEGNTGGDIILGGSNGGGVDFLYGDAVVPEGNDGRDVMLGDNGTILLSNGQLVSIDTTGENNGGADTIDGHDGNDIIIGGPNGSTDTLFGSAGDDVILGDNGLLAFNIDGDLVLISSAPDQIGGMDEISGNAGNDILIGGTGGDQIYGDDVAATAGTQDGADIILGDNGEIILAAGIVAQVRTTDTEESTGGSDTIYGNAGSDIIVGGVNGDEIYGNGGDDIILGDNGLFRYDVDGQTEADLLTLDLAEALDTNLGGADIIHGNTGSDVILGQTTGDTLYGDEDNDLLLGDFGCLTWVSGASMQMTLTENTAGGGDTIYGGTGDDEIYGQIGADTLYGDSGHDVLFGDFGSIMLVTDSQGDPLLHPNGSFLKEFLLLLPESGSGDTMHGGDGDDAMFGGTGNDFMSGNDGDDYMEGNSGADTMFGGADEDDMIGGSSGLTVPDKAYRSDGIDVMDGGDGHDVLLGDNGRIVRQIDPVTNMFIRYAAGNDGPGSGLGLENNAVIRDITLLEPDEIGAGDQMYGGAGDDIMHGEIGDDHMYGNAGNDQMYGELGDDTMEGGAGDDGMIGDKGTLAGDVLDGSTQTTLETPGDVLTVQVNIAGTIKWYVTLENADVGGNDTMLGGAGNDAMHGGFGNDVLFGDEGNDALFGYLGNDVMNGGADADHMYGGAGNDNMDGGTGADILYGGEGSDRLVADIEQDRLIDWIKSNNTFIKPISSKGFPTVINNRIPWVQKFLLDLTQADGVMDPSNEILIPAMGE